MLRYIPKSTGHPDYSSGTYTTDEPYPLRVFVSEILKTYPRDYGVFKTDSRYYRYKEGNLIDSMSDIGDKIISKVEVNSSYYEANYTIEFAPCGGVVGNNDIFNQEEVEEKENIGFDELVDRIRKDLEPIIEKYNKKIGTPITKLTYTQEGCCSVNFSTLEGLEISV